MQIHLAKPGGEKRGPYSLEQINSDLAARKYRDADYWAWYEGAEAWVPLYEVPGISIPSSHKTSTAAAEIAAESPPIATEPQLTPRAASAPANTASPVATATRPEKSPTSAASSVSAGMPFESLQQIFIFTSGEGRELMQSPAIAKTMHEIIGTDWSSVREKTPRDVFGRCDIAERLRNEGKVPSHAWRAMSAVKPDLVQQARAGTCHTCVRTFSIETGELVAVFLLYDKQKVGHGKA